MADDPVVAMQSLLARSFGQHHLRKIGPLNKGEYAVSIAGDCMG
jgi:hypothetical protein